MESGGEKSITLCSFSIGSIRYWKHSMILKRRETEKAKPSFRRPTNIFKDCGRRTGFTASIQKRILRRGDIGYGCTLVETQKKEAFFSYEGYKAYQPFNVWWASKGGPYTEFRDGNVPAGYEQSGFFKSSGDASEGSQGLSSFGYGWLSA